MSALHNATDLSPPVPNLTMTDVQVSRPDRWGEFWLPKIWWKPAATPGEAVRRRVCVHLIPILFCLYIVAYLDRSNLGWAQIDLKKSVANGGLAFTSEIIGLGASMFFYGYWILEIPSTLSVLKRGARYVFVRILVLWGICATLMGFIGDERVMGFLFGWLPKFGGTEVPVWKYAAHYLNELPTSAEYQLYFLRFMLGVFEGGFFPTVIFFLSTWFRQQDRAKAIALFMAAIPLSLAFGSELSKQLLKLQWFDLKGWQWIFIIQGIMPIVAAIGTGFLLPNRPRETTWLTEQERNWLQAELDLEHHAKQSKHGFAGFRSQIGMVLLLTMVYFGQNVSSYGLSTFMPVLYGDFLKSEADLQVDSQLKPLRKEYAEFLVTLRKQYDPKSPEFKLADERKQAELKPRLEPLEAAEKIYSDKNRPWLFLLTTTTYLIAFAGMMFNGWHSDKTQERIGHVAIPLITLGCLMLLAAYFMKTPAVSIVIMLVGVGFFHYSHLPAFWPIPTMFLGSAAAASAIGFINMIGNLGGSTGQTLFGFAPDTQTGIYYIAPGPIIAGLIVLSVGMLTTPPQHQSKSE